MVAWVDFEDPAVVRLGRAGVVPQAGDRGQTVEDLQVAGQPLEEALEKDVGIVDMIGIARARRWRRNACGNGR